MGFFPIAPASFASAIVCVGIWFLLKSVLICLVSLVAIFAIGVWVSTKVEKLWGEDSKRIVIDESVGMTITLIAVPHKLLYFCIGFLLFRVFDILKPYPINISQRLKGGWGIVIDDVIAGMYSSIFLWIFIFVYTSFASI